MDDLITDCCYVRHIQEKLESKNGLIGLSMSVAAERGINKAVVIIYRQIYITLPMLFNFVAHFGAAKTV